MTESIDSPMPPQAAHPGDLIRTAREARGWSLSHMSMLLKLPERRLQAFEEGRWEDVGDRTFVRALAQSLSRHLSIDPAPLLQSLPQAAEGQSWRDGTPARGSATAVHLPSPAPAARRPGVRVPSSGGGAAKWRRPSVLIGALILLAAAGLAFAPASWWAPVVPVTTEVVQPVPTTPVAAEDAASAPPLAPTAAGSGAEAPLPAPSSPAPLPAPVPPKASAARAPAASTAPPEAAAASTGPWGSESSAVAPVRGVVRPAQTPRSVDEPALRLTISQTSWIQVTDAQGQVLVSRLIPAGERVELVGARPLSLRVGNVAGVQAQWRGQDIDLSAYQRSNVAQVELP